MARKISSDLYNTVKNNRHIKEVNFCKNGNYCFDAFDVDEAGKKVKYARTFDVVVSKPGLTVGEKVKKGVPETLIVETIKRDDILKLTPEAIPPALTD